MRLYLDTEFNGWLGKLISIAMVGDDGREFYAVHPLQPKSYHPWVLDNVVPKLELKPMRSIEEFNAALHRFMVQCEGAEIIADWPCDFKYLMDCLVVDSGVRMPFDGTLRLVSGLDCKPENPHNALSDARALRSAYLDELSRQDKMRKVLRNGPKTAAGSGQDIARGRRPLAEGSD